MIFLLLWLNVNVFAGPACMGTYYDSLDYDLRCVACGVQKSTPTNALASPGWLTLMSIVSQKYHIPSEKKSDENFRRKKLIQLVSSYGVCFTPQYRARIRQPFWQRVSKGRQPASDINGNYANDFWNAFGLRYDGAALGGLFGCDEEKGCGSGIEYYFQADGKKWSDMTPIQRQAHLKNALSKPIDAVHTQGSIGICMNELKEQMSEIYSGINGTFNFRDQDSSNPNISNVAFCQNLADSCNIDKSFCIDDWKYVREEQRQISSEK